ncbi:hypothetical protein HaLaN_17042 [Haematococcus lacustris]|uniref:Uncharacterized protein n=1 Tax=Haematococcus lacustris TaxID=44745 RepID=A0A699ZBE3_HAELA|nr:hypothetical protein HaLaN_17042 [Haematococcus lacustris]
MRGVAAAGLEAGAVVPSEVVEARLYDQLVLWVEACSKRALLASLLGCNTVEDTVEEGGGEAGDTLVCADPNGVFGGSECPARPAGIALGVSRTFHLCTTSSLSKVDGFTAMWLTVAHRDLFAGTCSSTRAKTPMDCADGQTTRIDVQLPM